MKENKSPETTSEKPTEEKEYKTYWMVHRGEKCNPHNASVATYMDEKKAMEDAMKLAMDNPTKRFYVLKTVAVFESKVEKSYLDFRAEDYFK